MKAVLDRNGARPAKRRPLEPGEPVRLGEGGLLMTVLEVLSDGSCWVEWRDQGGVRRTGRFEGWRLKRAWGW